MDMKKHKLITTWRPDTCPRYIEYAKGIKVNGSVDDVMDLDDPPFQAPPPILEQVSSSEDEAVHSSSESTQLSSTGDDDDSDDDDDDILFDNVEEDHPDAHDEEEDILNLMEHEDTSSTTSISSSVEEIDRWCDSKKKVVYFCVRQLKEYNQKSLLGGPNRAFWYTT